MIGSVGQRVRQLRTARGLTLSQLAALAGTDAPSLSRLETGKTDLHVSTLERVAAGLNSTPSDLFAEMPPPARTRDRPLTIPATALELGIEPLALKRLVARRRLKAYRLGPDGDWRISATEVSQYVASGAPDFAFPEIEGPWLAPVRSAEGFAQAVRDAAAPQMPDQAPAVEEGQLVQLQVTPVVLAVIQGLPRGPFGAIMAGSGFPDWRTAYLVDLVRATVYRAMPVSQQAPLERLYESPEIYARMLAEATVRVLAGAIGMSRAYLFKDAGGPGGPWRPVQFELPHKRLLTGNAWATVLELAF